MVAVDERKKGADFSSYGLSAEDLLQQINMLKAEISFLRAQNRTLSLEKQRLEKTLEGFKNTPGIVGVISEVYGDKAVVRGYNGMVFYINIPERFKEKIRPDVRVAMAQNNLAILEILPEERDHRVNAFEVIEKPKVSFKDIGGLNKVIQEVEETISLPLRKPRVFERFGIESPKGILLYGPPGTGKTLLAKAIANEAKATFISVSGSELIHKFIGEGAKIVKDLFKMAREKAPSIIFIDEIDAVAAYRMDVSTGAEREVNRTMMQLLVELDGFRPNEKVKVIAATNRIDIIDEALLRPGRFDRVIEVPLPDEKGRYEILKIHTKRMPLGRDVRLREIAKEIEGASGADIEAICREAAIFAIRENANAVEKKHFKEAIKKVMGEKEAEEEVKHGKMYL